MNSAPMRASPWLFPVIATIHLMGLSVLGGSVLLVDLRLLGLGLRRQPVAQLAQDAERWLFRGLLVMVATGIPLFMCFATKYYYLTFFWVKMAALGTGILFVFEVKIPLLRLDHDSLRPATLKLVAIASTSLWFLVAASGRWIGFS